MRILLTGGAGNGKSTFARQLATQLPSPRYYVLTGSEDGAETAVDRQRARELRQTEAMQVLRCCEAPWQVPVSDAGVLVVDCLCHLTARAMFDVPGGMDDVPQRVLVQVQALEQKCEHLIVITNEVGSGCGRYTDETPRYIKALGQLNRALAQRFDCVCELVSGIPNVVKGSLPVSPAYSEPDWDLLLVIGGSGAGKQDYVRQLGWQDWQMSADPWSNCPVLTDLQDLTEPVSPRLLEQLRTKRVIICDEVGSGVIPVEESAREGRIRTGSLCVRLARHAKQVVRLLCGIPVVLKENDG